MLTLTRKTDYALVALAHLAEIGGGESRPVSARVIADQYALPIQVLVKVLKDLHRARIVGSTRGAHGGYYLDRPAENVTIADVADALEGRVRLTPCCEDNDAKACAACATQPVCPISGRVRLINDTVRSLFRRITLRDLLSEELSETLAIMTGGRSQWPALRSAELVKVNV